MSNKLQFCIWYAAYVAAIHVIPGPWQGWTSRGRTIDPWTATHLLWGFIGGNYQLPLFWLLAASCANEALEAYLRHIQFMGIWGDPETPMNIAADLAATSLGWQIARYQDSPSIKALSATSAPGTLAAI